MLEHEREEIKTRFKELDLDRDGVLSFEELKGLLCQNHIAQKKTTTLSSKDVAALFSEVDQDCDGVVSFDEFVDYVYSSRGGIAKSKAKASSGKRTANASKPRDSAPVGYT